jgi:predicted dehydrogenase
MLASKTVDAIIIATLHYYHPPVAIAAFDAGVHVLCEKPLAVTIGAAREVVLAHQKKNPKLKFGMMLNQRTSPLFGAMRRTVRDGTLGEVTRVSWIVTSWFRTHGYYASGGWRATWKGEGGGVLVNQCPHNLDLMQWITGLMPSRITAIASLGKTHPIEVEDEVSAILEYPNGAIGHFITTTGEAPGTNHFEVCGDHGKIVAENGKLSFHRLHGSQRELRTSGDMWAKFESSVEEIELAAPVGSEHRAMTQNFINAILHDEPLIAPGAEGVPSVELSNSMLLAGVTRTPVDLPLDAERYDQFLQEMISRAAARKK